MRPNGRFAANGSQFIRQWKLLVLLRQKPHTLTALAEKLNCCERTVRRDIQVLEAVPFPIERADFEDADTPHWRIGELAAWPKRQASPAEELGGMA